MGSLEANRFILNMYLQDWEGTLPKILSPLKMDLEGLPPMLIQVGSHEVLLSDAVRLAQRSRAAGINVDLEIWEGMWSVFQSMAYMLPEGEEAIT
ncbi:alpha/beta hydrolase [Paenibacillus pinihumi]|uniref:alpha/beta hydrolase n=1 Tax=Paenibacillus pinihumi TaxID=669462 RepID=UPI0003F5D1C6|nr:alpha/beta hydrolase [Paenibacillus pinihumi]